MIYRKICIDERGRHIEDYEAAPTSDDFENMDCSKWIDDFLLCQSLSIN